MRITGTIFFFLIVRVARILDRSVYMVLPNALGIDRVIWFLKESLVKERRNVNSNNWHWSVATYNLRGSLRIAKKKTRMQARVVSKDSFPSCKHEIRTYDFLGRYENRFSKGHATSDPATFFLRSVLLKFRSCFLFARLTRQLASAEEEEGEKYDYKEEEEGFIWQRSFSRIVSCRVLSSRAQEKRLSNPSAVKPTRQLIFKTRHGFPPKYEINVTVGKAKNHRQRGK